MHKTIKERIRIISLIPLVVIPIITIRLFYVQIISQRYYSLEAEKNLDRYRDTAPRRGAIYDSKRKLVVKTAPEYIIAARPGEVTPEATQNLSILLQKDTTEIEAKLAELWTKSRNQLHTAMKRIFKLVDDKDIATYDTTVANFIQQHGFLKPWKIKRKVQRDALKSYDILSQKMEQAFPKRIRAKKYYKTLRSQTNDYFRRTYYMYKKIHHAHAMEMKIREKTYFAKSNEQAEVRNEFEGYKVLTSSSRRYPHDNSLIHVLGRVGAITREEYRQKQKDYRLNDIVGKSGIERIFEEQMRGRRGCYVDSRQLGLDFWDHAIDGMDLQMTIDIDAQKVAEQLLDDMVAKRASQGATGGAAVVMDIYDGSVLVMATSPRYEVLDFSDPEKYEAMVKNKISRPLENRAISSYYPIPPGSTYKIMVALYALEQGLIDKNTEFYCRGYFKRPGSFRCTHVHHKVRLIKAIEGSCNIYFYHLGEMLGPKYLEHCARLFGFGSKSGLGLAGEYSGEVPTPELKARYNEPWYKGDSRFFAIGQRLKATPLQVARAMAMVANRGTLLQPKLVRKFYPSNYITPADYDNQKYLVSSQAMLSAPENGSIVHQWLIRQNHWLLVRKGMARVIDGEHGTARKLGQILGNTKIASKTGTSEVAGKPDHSWFAGFFPLDNPRYSFAVLIEHGGYGGSSAGPVAAKLINTIVNQNAER